MKVTIAVSIPYAIPLVEGYSTKLTRIALLHKVQQNAFMGYVRKTKFVWVHHAKSISRPVDVNARIAGMMMTPHVSLSAKGKL
jgi:hypothetical protein